MTPPRTPQPSSPVSVLSTGADGDRFSGLPGDSPAESAPDPRPTRFGVAFRLGGALMAVIALMAVTAVLTLTAFDRLHRDFRLLATENLPLLVTTMQLAQQSESIIAHAPALAAAEKQIDRETVALRMADQVHWLEELLQRLEQAGFDPHSLKQMAGHKQELVENLAHLNALVETRIQNEERKRQRVEVLLRLRRQIRESEETMLPEASEVESSVIHRWARASQSAIAAMLGVGDTLRHSQVERLAGETRSTLLESREALALLPEPVRLTLAVYTTALENIAGSGPGGSGPGNGGSGNGGPGNGGMTSGAAGTSGRDDGERAENLFAIRSRLIDAGASIAGSLTQNKGVSERFVTAASALTRRLQETIDAGSRASTATTDTVAHLVMVIAGLCLLGGLVAHFHINRQVVRRLEAVRHAMVTHVAGHPAPFDTEGRDEISDIARSANYFVTSLERREEALAAAKEEAETANRAKSIFLAAMSHEIRTPMNGVMTMAELLEQSPLSTEQRGMAVVMRDSASALLTIIDDILDFSKIEAGRMELEQVPCPVREIAEGVADLLAARAEEKRLEFLVRVAPEVPFACFGDPVRLRQILVNLAGNAVKFTLTGHVAIDVTLRQGETTGNWLRFTVTDTGIGVAPEHQSRLFRPFMQADPSTARQFGGTGLGLSICQRLVAMMGGVIAFTSRPGVGSVFWFEIPLRSDESLPPPVEVGISGARVLVVHPAPAFLENVASRLADAGAVASVATGSEAAERLLRSKPFDALLIDHDLDSESGRSFAGRLLTHRQTGGARLLLTLPRTCGEEREAARKGGFFAVLDKPLRQATLVRAIAAALGRTTLDDLGHGRELRTYSPPPLAAARAANALILVAEDNPTNQVVIRKLLDRLGFAAEVVANGVEALHRLEQGGYGLLLTDCHMPEMDGYTLTRRLRALEAAARQSGPIRPRLPVIALTADALVGTSQLCLDAGMDDYLTKPVDIRHLEHILAQRLPQGLPLRQEVVMRAHPSFSSSPSSSVPPPLPVPASGLPAGSDAPGEPEVSQTPLFSTAPFSTAPSSAPLLTEVALRTPNPSLLDIQQITETFGALDEGAFELLDLFVSTSQAQMISLEAAMAGGKPTEARELAHALAGASRMAGAPRLGQAFAALEQALIAGPPDRVQEFLVSSRVLLPQVIAAIQALAAQHRHP